MYDGNTLWCRCSSMRRACLWTFSLLKTFMIKLLDKTSVQVKLDKLITIIIINYVELHKVCCINSGWAVTGSVGINSPGKRSKEEAVIDNRTKLLCTKLIREQGEVSSQQVEEDVAEGHVIIGLHCVGREQTLNLTICTLSLLFFFQEKQNLPWHQYSFHQRKLRKKIISWPLFHDDTIPISKVNDLHVLQLGHHYLDSDTTTMHLLWNIKVSFKILDDLCMNNVCLHMLKRFYSSGVSDSLKSGAPDTSRWVFVMLCWVFTAAVFTSCLFLIVL